MAKRRVLFSFAMLTLFAALPAFAQEATAPAAETNRRSSGDGGGGRSLPGNMGGMSGSASISSRSAPMGGIDYSSQSRGYAAGPASVAPAGGGHSSSAPNLQGTSFTTLNSYYDWQNYYWRMRTMYMLNGLYFSRFYRNTEPLITPELMMLTLRAPLSFSTQMVAAVDQLQVMLTDLQAGKQVSKQEIADKTREIRDLAKKIREDQSLAFVDQRLDQNIGKGNQFDNLGLTGIDQLRELVTDLHTQLKGMYNQSTTSSISVQSLSQPSFASLSKGIEKLTKVIEASARRL
jgi:hypothetical protein